MTEITLDDIRAAIHVLKAKYDDMVADAIGAELVPLEPLYDKNITERSDAAREAMSALDKPQQELSELLREIERTEGKCLEWQAKTTDTVTELRVEAHGRFRDWCNELERLQGKRDQLEQEIEPLQQTANEATSAAQDAIMGKAYWGVHSRGL